MREATTAMRIAFRWSGATLLLLVSLPSLSATAEDPGKATTLVHGDRYALANRAVAAEWNIANRCLSGIMVTDKWNQTTIQIPEPFSLTLKDGTILSADSFHSSGKPAMHALAADPNAPRFSDRLAGEQFDLPLTSSVGDLHIVWSMVLRDGSNYVRQLLTIAAVGKDVPISQVKLIEVSIPGAHVVGSVKGSPIVAGDLFLGFEDPLSESSVVNNRAAAVLDRQLPLRKGQAVTYSSVIGIARTGQLRRDFLNYIERERAHPYRTFLHYNSWYDLGYLTPYDEAGALNRINAFGTQLHLKRGVILDSFLFDDGWDNHASLWKFNSGFPNGFAVVRKAAAKYGAAPGVWMSPWGGYEGPKKERLTFGKAADYEIVDGGFALSGPKYYRRFRDVCLQMIREYGVNQFKFDGTGNANTVFPGSAFDSDFDAAIHLIGDLRRAEPNIFINLTTGTYPSPFWLFYADSTWRGGQDQSVAGVGPYRERWITYRDADTYQKVVKAGPLYPLNSLMLHGIIFAQYNQNLNTDPQNDFRNEVRSYFGTGTECQEMYITPSLLTSANWDDLAEAVRWSRANAAVLRDTHWIGGDPSRLEVYGWASWTPKKGILTLRNPSDHAQSIRIDLQDAFELPSGAPQNYTATSPWKEYAGNPGIELRAHTPHEFQLAPFEVLTLEFTPDRTEAASDLRPAGQAAFTGE
jgi:hypothetical protein